MKTIKQRILISFCIAAAGMIATIGVTVSWRMSSSVSRQSEAMAEYMSGRTYKVADSYNEMLRTVVDDLKKETHRTTKDLSGDTALAHNIESQQLAPLAARLQAAAASSGADFIAIFDVQGRLQAAVPKEADATITESYYQSWELGSRVRDRLKSKEAADDKDLVSITRHDSQLLKGIGLGALDVAGKGGISIAAAGIVRNDFQEPMGVCITVKLLNRYNAPLRKLHEATGAAPLVYLENIPIAHAGLLANGDTGNEASLQIDAKAREKVLKAPKTANQPLVLAGKNYVTSCSTLSATNGEKVALLCAALPGQQIVEAQQAVYALGNETKGEIQIWILAIGVLALISFIVVALMISRGIVQPISQAIKGLVEGSVQVAAASEQISTASQALAEAASGQASAIEESSSSLEEMASMTRQNADNAKLADGLMQQASKEAGLAKQSMAELIVSMGEISKASEDTSKIVKTIDEIAFQTNLLALNAAVEAARAGDAGAGFAVVAGEVRTLALRATDAAKNTAGLIEVTLNRVKEGVARVNKTNDAFAQVAGGTHKGGELVAEIAAASGEQAQGITQINRAVVEMDKLVQQTASNAEESASASEELTSQAEQMKGYVDDLALLIGGTGSDSAGGKGGNLIATARWRRHAPERRAILSV
ncbi:MAG: methyl-accepting chemotaxis protein [Syntrophales bacterium]